MTRTVVYITLIDLMLAQCNNNTNKQSEIIILPDIQDDKIISVQTDTIKHKKENYLFLNIKPKKKTPSKNYKPAELFEKSSDIYYAPTKKNPIKNNSFTMTYYSIKTDPISDYYSPELSENFKIFTAIFDNDVYFGTDFYYTNGIKFELIHPGLKKLPLKYLLYPFYGLQETYFGLSFVQNMYTPVFLDVNNILTGDRPFASYLTLDYFKISLDPVRKTRFNSALSFGLIGPGSLGGEVQNIIHDIEPTGWKYQISNDLIINYSLTMEKIILFNRGIELSGIINGQLGSLYNNIGGGIKFSIGNYSAFNTIRNFNPHIPVNDNKFRYNFFITTKGFVIGYDATLQGGLLNSNSIYTLSDNDISRIIYKYSAGINLQYRKISLNVQNNYISQEFKNAKPHWWLSITASIRL